MVRQTISLENITLRLNKTTVFDGLTLDFKSQGLTLLIGANGSGKTQLLRLIHGLVLPQAGRVVAPASSQQVLLYQSPVLLNRSVIDNLKFLKHSAYHNPVYFSQQLPGISQRFNLANILQTSATRLSGGQQKRVTVARLLLQKADYYLFDEPTANVDYQTSLLLESVIEDLLAQGKKVIVTTHDIVQMERLFSVGRDEMVLLEDGQLICQTDHLDIEYLKQFL